VATGNASGSYIRTWGGDSKSTETDFNAGVAYSYLGNFGPGSTSVPHLLQLPLVLEQTWFLDPVHSNSVFAEGLLAPSAALKTLDSSDPLWGVRVGAGVGFTSATDRALISLSAHGYLDATSLGLGAAGMLMLTIAGRVGRKDKSD